MADVGEIIDFIKSLKKGFDKDLFQIKINDLACAVETCGLVYDDFHTLFKVWLNLSLPITKWVSLGSCLVPPDTVEEKTLKYALRWILAHSNNKFNFSRIGFLLDWLTAAMECESIDMTALDIGYEVFYKILTFDVLTVHAVKLVYTLTKPVDVTRRRVLDLIEYSKQRAAKKNMFRQIQVLLGLFKSYKPECVPEDIPAISIHTAFKKLNESLLLRFRMTQERRNRLSKDRHHLLWINPINFERGRNKKAEPLVPNVEILNLANTRIHEQEPPKSILDFTDSVSVVQYSLQHVVSRPARLRALLCNATGQTILAISPQAQQAFLSHDLHHLLNSCFLEVSPYSYAEKRDFLIKLAAFQRTLVQGIPVVTRFLAQYLPLWNERDHFAEILQLIEWVSVDSPEHVQCIADALAAACLRAPPVAHCAIVRGLTHMYTNLVYSSTKSRQHFLNTPPSPSNYALVLPDLAGRISLLCNKGLQIDPDDLRIAYSGVWSARRCACAELSRGAGGAVRALPAACSLAVPLLGVSAALIDAMAELMILYKKIMWSSKTKNEEHVQILSQYMIDMLNCLYSEEALSRRADGLLFRNMHPQLVGKLAHLIPEVDAKLSIRNHLAFASYTYVQLAAIDNRQADNKLLFNSVIDQVFPNLSRFLKKALPELRY